MQPSKARYTLATEWNSTLSALSKVDHVTLAPYTPATKSKGCSTFGRQKLPTFDKVGRVEHVQLWRQCWLRHGRESRTSRRQSTFDKLLTKSEVSAAKLTVDFVAGFGDCRDFVASVYRPGFRLYSCTKCFGFPSVQFLFTTPTMWNDLLAKLNPLTCTWPHLRCDAGLDEGEY